MKVRKNRGDELAVDMSPMIDLVFLLLIFFLVASSIIKVDKVKVEIPEAVYAIVPEDTTGRFEITVTTGGLFYVDQVEVTIDELKVRLGKEIEANPKVRVVVRGDGKVEYQESQKVLEACAEVGANDLIFAAFEK